MRWLFVFALVLLICTAAPVLAGSDPKPDDRGAYLKVDGSRIGISAAQAASGAPSDAQASGSEMVDPGNETEPEQEENSDSASPPSAPIQPVSTEPVLEPIEDGPLQAPSGGEVRGAVEEDERAQEITEDWLESEEAVRQREESRHAFADISATEAEELLPLFFSLQLAALNGDPARLLADLDVVKPLGPNAALISEGEGEFSLLESSTPIESEVGQESKQPLDLDLERSGESFIAKNPLADMSLPDSALGSIRLESGIEIGLPAAADRDARPVEDVGLIYSESEKATDTVVVPVTAGVEVFQQLRSAQSPETIRFDLSLPPETRLVPTEGGGAAIISASEEGLVTIPPPWAVDAQGSAVPVAMSIEGHSLLLAIPHRSGEPAYPILVDPAFIEEGAPVGNWGAAWTDQYNLWNNPVLGAQAKGSSYSYAANSFGHWVWTTHGGTTYISQATFSPTTFTLPSNCATEQPTNQPHGYAGLYNPSTNVYSGLGIWFGSSSSGGYGTLENAGGPGVRQAIVGIGAGSSSVKHKCAITFEVGGVTVRQKDPEAPTFNSVEASSAWTAGGSNIVVGTTVSDPGLGVQQIDIHPEGASEAPAEFHHYVGCTGTYASQCPPSRYHQFVINPAQFQAGETTTKLSAKDPLGGPGHESTYMFPTRVDRTPPVVDLQGQLATITKQEGKAEKEQALGADELRFPVYNLQIKGTDVGPNGNPAGNPWERRSGVKNIKIFLRDEELGKEEELEVPWSAQGCSGPTYSCPMEKTYPLELAGREMGDYRLRVLVEDQVGRRTERKLKFSYIPATGMKDEYVMQYFPLPDSSGDEEAEEHPRRPELAVNVMSGNLVFRQRDVDVEGAAVDLEVERFYNSQLPESEDTEWGDGWTLAQTPTLEPEGSGTPTEATMVAESGLVQSEVDLPSKVGEEVFDPELQAAVTRETGGYSVTDETGESAGTFAFDESGRTTELETGEYSGVEYQYEEGELNEIAVSEIASTDLLPEEVAELEAEANAPIPLDSIGTQGTGNGQFEYAQALARDPEGNLWVGDLDTTKGTNRIQKFDSDGNFLDQITAPGAGGGTRLYVSGLDTDPEGNLWITDWSHARVEVFDKDGNFIRRFGTQGTGNGQFELPEGIAIDAKGHVWVADKRNGRLQEFTATGEFIKVVGSKGTEPGQLSSPNSIAVAPNGEIWVTDFSSNRVHVFEPDGTFVRRFGFQGSGPGQFDQPGGIAVDGNGHVWVGDQLNNRVQVFTETGDFIRQLGEKGTGPDQLHLCYTIGLVADGTGGIWITDYNNHRVQHLRVVRADEADPLAGVQDDPSVDVETDSGLVESVEGEEAGEVSYEHDDQLLTSVEGPAGTTSYDYDEEFNGDDRLTEVTLPNGTYAQISYDTKGRVKSVTVSNEGGTPETTAFQYQDEPSRRTTVKRPSEMPIVYDFGDDGSVLKWQSENDPPGVVLSGSLYAGKETSSAIEPGDYELVVEASSPASDITSIEVIANGTTLVSEKTCEAPCPEEEDRWVMNTGSWSPGVIYLEALVTDSTSEVASRRFWVNIPYAAPPDPEAEAAPTFSEVLNFREEYGLDLDVKNDERALNNRIFDLIWAWRHPGTPDGKVARATNGRWGSPLRLRDAAELEYRERYLEQASSVIPAWASANASGAYAGFYMDHRSGGILRVGFTADQASSVAQLRAAAGLMASDRIATFPYQPTRTLTILESSLNTASQIVTGPPAPPGIVSVSLDVPANRLRLGTMEVAATEAFAAGSFGGGAGVTVAAEAPSQTFAGRYKAGAPFLAATYIANGEGKPCMAGFGAWKRYGRKPNGEIYRRRYVLTAGHCFPKTLGASSTVYRPRYKGDLGVEIGKVELQGFTGDPNRIDTDAEAIEAEEGLVPSWIYECCGGNASVRVTGVAFPRAGETVCQSSQALDRVTCGPVTNVGDFDRLEVDPKTKRLSGWHWMIRAAVGGGPGDSGGPVWMRETGKAVGLVAGGGPEGLAITPFKRPPNATPGQIAGIFSDPSLSEPARPLHVQVGK